MTFFLILAALTLLTMMGSFLYLTREDRALLSEQDTLPADLRHRPISLMVQHGEYKQAA